MGGIGNLSGNQGDDAAVRFILVEALNMRLCDATER